jgi:hypothetical protein
MFQMTGFHSFLSLSSIPFLSIYLFVYLLIYLHVSHISFTHSSANGHFGFFNFLAIVTML